MGYCKAIKGMCEASNNALLCAKTKCQIKTENQGVSKS